MATLTVRNIPKEVVARLKQIAAENGRSMEGEVRQLLEERYARRDQVLERIRKRTAKYPGPTAREVQRWIEAGRHGRRIGL